MHIRLLHARVDSGIFLFALLDVPTRQTVFDLAVRPRVLIEHGDSNSVIRQNLRRHRAGNRTANYRHEMPPRIRHISATPHIAARLYNAITSQSLLNRDNPTLAYPTHPQLAVDAYHLTRQSGVQFRRIESQVETGRTECEGLDVCRAVFYPRERDSGRVVAETQIQ